MEQWEYLTCFLQAEVTSKESKEFIEERFKKRAKRFSPEGMIPELNQLGAAGWELIHMEPVARIGGKEDVLMGGSHIWSNSYFCVLKRRLPGSVVPMVQVNQGQLPVPPVDESLPLPPPDAPHFSPKPTKPLDPASLPPTDAPDEGAS